MLDYFRMIAGFPTTERRDISSFGVPRSYGTFPLVMMTDPQYDARFDPHFTIGSPQHVPYVLSLTRSMGSLVAADELIGSILRAGPAVLVSDRRAIRNLRRTLAGEAASKPNPVQCQASAPGCQQVFLVATRTTQRLIGRAGEILGQGDHDPV